jgi:enoyl-CoA hydratase
MTESTGPDAIDRRSLLAAGSAAVAAAAMGVAGAERAYAQAAPPPASAPQAPAPGKVSIEKLPGGILMIGIDRSQAKNRIDPPILIGLGKAYYQLDHDDS